MWGCTGHMEEHTMVLHNLAFSGTSIYTVFISQNIGDFCFIHQGRHFEFENALQIYLGYIPISNTSIYFTWPNFPFMLNSNFDPFWNFDTHLFLGMLIYIYFGILIHTYFGEFWYTYRFGSILIHIHFRILIHTYFWGILILENFDTHIHLGAQWKPHQ